MTGRQRGHLAERRSGGNWGLLSTTLHTVMTGYYNKAKAISAKLLELDFKVQLARYQTVQKILKTPSKYQKSTNMYKELSESTRMYQKVLESTKNC